MKGCWSLYSNNKSTVCLAVFSSRTLKQNKAKSKIAEDNIKHLNFPLLTFEIEIISKESNPKPTEVSGKILLTHACLFLTLKLVIPASYFFFFFFRENRHGAFCCRRLPHKSFPSPDMYWVSSWPLTIYAFLQKSFGMCLGCWFSVAEAHGFQL